MINFVQYTALMESVYEKHSLGQLPPEEWLVQIDWAQSNHPEWTVPPPPPVASNGHTNGSNGHNGANGFIVPPPPPPPSSPPRAAIVTNKGERPDITVGDNMEEVSRNVLAWWGTRYCVFQAGGRLLEVQTDSGKDVEFLAREPDSPRMVAVGSARARTLASRECNFVKEKSGKDGKEENINILPPEWLGPSITTRTDFPGVPVFAALAQAPTLRRDGALIFEPGYDKSTGIFLTENLSVTIPENPSHEDAKSSATKLLDLLCDFDFVNPAGKSTWLAGLLSVACRHTFNGPAPIFIVDASKRGSGKTRLVDMISIITTGRSAPRMIYTPDDSEMDKRIVALGTAAPQIVLIDNIVGKLSSPSLDAVLTCDTYSGRVLQKSEMSPSMPMKMVWFATGNGMIIGADTARRALLARLEPPVDHPEYRSGPKPGTRWQYKLPDYCLEHRADLLGYALTIVAAYIRAGRPSVKLGDSTGSLEMGSYEKWSDTIRSAIVWAGALDPCDTIKDAQAADLEELALRTMVNCWPVADNIEVTAHTLLGWAELNPPLSADVTIRDSYEQTRSIRELWRNALLNWLPARPGNPLPTARDLGYALRSVKGSIIEKYKIEASEPLRSGIPWQRKRIDGSVEETLIKNTHTLSAIK